MKTGFSVTTCIVVHILASANYARGNNIPGKICPPGFVLNMITNVCEVHPVEAINRNQSDLMHPSFQSLYNLIAYPSLSLMPAPPPPPPVSSSVIIIKNADNSTSTRISSNNITHVEVKVYPNNNTNSTSSAPKSNKLKLMPCSTKHKSSRSKPEFCLCSSEETDPDEVCICDKDRVKDDLPSERTTTVPKQCFKKMYYCKELECIGASCSESKEISSDKHKASKCCRQNCSTNNECCQTICDSGNGTDNESDECKNRIRKGQKSAEDVSDENLESNDDINLDTNKLSKLILSTIKSYYNDAKTRVRLRNQQKYKIHRNYHKRAHPMKRYKIHYNSYKFMEERKTDKTKTDDKEIKTTPVQEETKENYRDDQISTNTSKCGNEELCINALPALPENAKSSTKTKPVKRVNTETTKPDVNVTENLTTREIKNITTTSRATTEIGTTEIATTEVATTEMKTTEMATTVIATTEIVTTENTLRNDNDTDYVHYNELEVFPPAEVKEESTTHATGSFRDKLNKLLVAPLHTNPLQYTILQINRLEHSRSVLHNPKGNDIVLKKEEERNVPDILRTSFNINKQLIMYKEKTTIPDDATEKNVAQTVTESKDSVENVMQIVLQK